MSTPPPTDAPLAGVVVVDLSRAVAGPHAAMMLGDLGARVVKIESPGHGDDARGWGPPFRPEPASAGDRESTYFLSANRNKESIALDLKHPDDLDVLLRLIDRADVLVENFRTGVMDRLGLGVAALHARNPGLIILSITGFGHDGPEGGRAGYDQIVQGEAGLMSITGEPGQPQKVGVPVADLLAGMNGAFGVTAALAERARTGRGRLIRTSLLAAVVAAHSYQGTAWTVAGVDGRTQGNTHPSLCPYGLYPTADGAAQIAVGSERLWRSFCRGFDLDPDAPGMATNGERVAHQDLVGDVVRTVFANRTTDDLLARLDELGIPAGRLRTVSQVYDWPQTRSQGLLIETEHERLGPLQLPGPPLRWFDVDGQETPRRQHTAPPVLDADAARVRDWLSTRPDGADPSMSDDPAATPAPDLAELGRAVRALQDDNARLHRELSVLRDKEAIRAVLDTYVFLLDSARWRDVPAAVFTDDAVDHHSPEAGEFAVPRGRAAIAEFLDVTMSGFAGSHHLLGNSAIEVDGDTAHSRTYAACAHWRTADEQPVPADFTVAVAYDDRWRRTPDGWRIHERWVHTFGPHGLLTGHRAAGLPRLGSDLYGSRDR